MIDRRIFLQLTGGVAAGAAGLVASVPAGAAEATAPSLVQVGDGVVSPLADPLRLLSERLQLASGSRLALQFAPSTSGRGGLILAREDEFAEAEPTSLLLGGYPFGYGAPDLGYMTWLRGAGGQALWDMAAARHGWKPLLVDLLGGADAVVWSRVPLKTERDLAGLRIAVPRAVHEPLKAFSAAPHVMSAADVLSAFEAGVIDAFETDDPALSLSAAEQWGGSVHCYTGSVAGTGCILSLRFPLIQWASLSAADQAIVEAVAQETAATLQAVRHVHRNVLVRRIAQSCRRRPRAFSMIIHSALGSQAAGLLPPRICDEPVYASMLASMKALVASPRDPDEILEPTPSA
jgi:TRAP-type mannitol/chloroaromatic compound transport system substrate-binding protein